MRALNVQEANGIRWAMTDSLMSNEADPNGMRDALRVAVSRGCVASNWVPCPGYPGHECLEYTATDLGRLALRVSIPGAPVPL